MDIPIYQIDAFAQRPFEGNPAAVCPLENWLDDNLMQKIAMENNLAETAFIVKEASGYRIRWFTPEVEIDLCGHATIASAFVMWEFLGVPREQIQFKCLAGEISVSPENDLLVLDFPARPIQEAFNDPAVESALNIHTPIVFGGKVNDKLLIELQDEDALKDLSPDFGLLKKCDYRAYYVTAKGNHYDFVSRMFAPQVGINEDPVTGSSFTTLAPYWSNKLNKNELSAKQISPRGGEVFTRLNGERVKIGGRAVCVLKGHITI